MTADDAPVPCPFCGDAEASAVIRVQALALSAPGQNAVRCAYCGARGPLVNGAGSEAIAAWNRRAPVEDGAARERAAIVAWLREEKWVGARPGPRGIAERIERGEHLPKEPG